MFLLLWLFFQSDVVIVSSVGSCGGSHHRLLWLTRAQRRAFLFFFFATADAALVTTTGTWRLFLTWAYWSVSGLKLAKELVVETAHPRTPQCQFLANLSVKPGAPWLPKQNVGSIFVCG
jgi:hypothetical protein